MTRRIQVGAVPVGGGAAVSIQSMCNTPTEDVNATVRQIQRLEQAGCEIVRVAVPTEEAARAIPSIKAAIHIPLVADIHFDYRLALLCVDGGVDKIRINPGNIGSKDRVRAVADACRERNIPIRVGVNGGSLEKDLLEKYEKLPEMEYERIVEIADLIDSIVKYTVNRAVKARNRDETYKWLMSTNSEQLVGEAEIQELSLPMSAREPERAETMPVKPSSVIYPAIAYINDHLRDGISMKEMADLCHLSPSYFSRTFNKETGESFVNYINRRKVALAKELLRETNKSITQIAEEAGYINISNFIAVFKRMEGVTPSVYRQHMYK